MAQSIKLGNDTYLDASGVAVNNSGGTLADINYKVLSYTSQYVNTSVSSLDAYKYGRIVMLYLNIGVQNNFPLNTEVPVATIDSKYLPNKKSNFTLAEQGGQGVLLQVYSNGSITLYLPSGSTRNFIRGTIAYISAS